MNTSIVSATPENERTHNDFFNEMDGFAKLVKEKWGVEPFWVAYAGGVPGMQAKLPDESYKEAKLWLQGLVGNDPPAVLERWHPDQRRGYNILSYKFTPEMHHLTIHHCNVIRMHFKKSKRYTLLSWM